MERYRIEGELGRGGMASVYLVRHTSLGTRHALKVLHIGGPRLQARLVREGRAQGDLRTPHVVGVTDIVDIGGSQALVLELVDGPSLDELLSSIRLTPDEADRLARGILRGVAAAHRAGLVHRDIKPANVLIEALEHDLVPKVADFGVAKLLEGEDEVKATRSGLSLGTPAYMAPEQIESAKHVDARADVFSLGALLYEILTGARAFEDSSILTTYNRVATGDYERLEDRVEGLPRRMLAAVEGALKVDPAQRFVDAGALLEAWCDGTSEPGPEVFRPAVLACARQVADDRTHDSVEVPRAIAETLEGQADIAAAQTHVLQAEPSGWARLRVWTVALVVGVLGAALVGTTLTAMATRRPRAVAARVEVEAPPAPLGHVRIEGDIPVELVDAQGRVFGAGDVPPGIYTVRGMFPEGPEDVRQISVVGDRTGTLSCRATPAGCAWTTR